jgi:uncharacterized protein
VRARRAFAVGGLAAAVAATALSLDVPYLSGRVNDYANLVPAATRERMESSLAGLEQRTGAQVAVLTIASLEGEPLEDYSMRVAETWKLGQEGKDNGVLVLVAKNDRKIRIEVGYGLEGRLTDASCRRIIDNVMRPEFQAGRFGEGLEKAVGAIAGTIEGKDVIPASAPSSSSDLRAAPWYVRLAVFAFVAVILGVFSAVALFSKGCSSWFLYLFLLPFYATFPVVLLTAYVGVPLLLAWIIGFPIAKFWLRRAPAGKAFLTAHPGWVSFATSSGHSGGGGGFSGGGGSFGGGGASGGW